MRVRGDTSRMMGLEFDESVLWRRKPIGDNLAEISILCGKG